MNRQKANLKPFEIAWIFIGLAGIVYALLCEYATHAPKLDLIAEEGKEFKFQIFRLADQEIILESTFPSGDLAKFFQKQSKAKDGLSKSGFRLEKIDDYINQARSLVYFSLEVSGQEPIEFSSEWGGNFSSLRHTKKDSNNKTILKRGINNITIKLQKVDPKISGSNMNIFQSSHNSLKQSNGPIWGVTPFGISIFVIIFPLYLFGSIALMISRRERNR